MFRHAALRHAALRYAVHASLVLMLLCLGLPGCDDAQSKSPESPGGTSDTGQTTEAPTGDFHAPPLADMIPADAVLYIGWRGANDIGEGYDESHLKAVLDASNIELLFTEFMPALARRAGQEEPDAEQAINLITTIGGQLWKHPTAFYLGEMEITERGPKEPKLALLIKAGDDAARLSAQINNALEDAGAPIRASAEDGLVTVSMGPLPAGPRLADDDGFQNTVGQVIGKQAFVGYLNGTRLMKMANQGVASSGEEDVIKIWNNIRDTLGLDGLKSAAISSGLNGKDWSTHMYVEAPAPRKGLMAMLDGEPLSDAALATVPKTAAWMGAFRFDLARLLGTIRQAVEKMDPRAAEQMNEAIAQLNEMLGMDIEKDFLAALGDEWVVYADRHVAGTGFLGVTIVNRLRNAEKFTDAAVKLQHALQGMLADMIGDEDGPHIRFQRTEYDGRTIHYLAVPMVAPSWTVEKDTLLMGLYPQVVASAAPQLGSSTSILDNPAFQALRKRLAGEHDVVSVNFYDLPQTADSSYQSLLFMMQLYMGFADLFGVKTPAIVMPPLHKLRPHLGPAGGFTWVTDAGWYAASVTPFPGAEMLGGGQGSNMMVGQAAVMAGVMLPALGAARQGARETQSINQLRQLTVAASAYAIDRKGKMPPDLGALWTEGYLIDSDIVISPSDAVAQPAQFQRLSKQEQAAWINANSSYCYVPTVKLEDEGSTIVLFEKLRSPDQTEIVACFTDGHTETLGVDEADALIRKQTGRSLRQWSEAPNPGAGGVQNPQAF